MAMIDSDVTELVENIPAPIQEAVKRAGLHALVAAHYDLPEVSLKTVGTLIGTKLAARRAERLEILTGLQALDQLTR